jgi:hypothetical protein
MLNHWTWSPLAFGEFPNAQTDIVVADQFWRYNARAIFSFRIALHFTTNIDFERLVDTSCEVSKSVSKELASRCSQLAETRSTGSQVRICLKTCGLENSELWSEPSNPGRRQFGHMHRRGGVLPTAKRRVLARTELHGSAHQWRPLLLNWAERPSHSRFVRISCWSKSPTRRLNCAGSQSSDDSEC